MDIGALLYGTARGMQDVERSDQTRSAFESDQAIRKERLSQEQELRPLRMRSAELGVKQGEQGLTLQDLQIDVTKLNKEQLEDANKRLREAQKKEKVLKLGLGRFHLSGDPQHGANAMAEIYPERAQMKEDGSHGLKATRESNGSILLTGPDGNTKVLKGGTTADGRKYNADEEFGMLLYKIHNPIEVEAARLKSDFAKELETVKQEGATTRSILAADSRIISAETRASAATDRATNANIRLGKSFLDAQLKTTSIPGHFANVYSSEDDAKLRRFMDVKMGEKIRNGTDPEKAASESIEETRNLFAGEKKGALDAAQTLTKSKVNPKDAKAVSAAVAKGDAAAKALLKSIGRIRRELGDDAAKYLFEQIPGPRK